MRQVFNKIGQILGLCNSEKLFMFLVRIKLGLFQQDLAHRFTVRALEP